MINEKIEAAFNQQINEEMYSWYLYLSMSANFEAQNLPGTANWLKLQAEEEMEHAMRLYDHIHQRGGTVTLLPIKEPPHEWETPLEAFEAAYKHECYITGCIHSLVDLAHEEKDHASASLLQWFVDEQIEEEASAEEIVEKLKLLADHPGGLYMFDKELGARQRG